MHINEVFDNNFHVPDLVQNISRNKWLVEPGLMARQTSRFMTMFKKNIARMTTLRDRNTPQTHTCYMYNKQ